MKYKAGDIISVNGAFADLWEKFGRTNKWVVKNIETKTRRKPSLYVCICVDKKDKMLYQFTEKEAV